MSAPIIKSLSVGGKEYPCRLTMGAMMRYEEVTGRKFADFDPTRAADLCALVWACAKSGCARERVEFPLGFQDFCDAVEPDEIAAAMAAVESDTPAPAAEDEEGEVKKN